MIPNVKPNFKFSTRRRQLRGGNEPWGGSLRVETGKLAKNRRQTHSRRDPPDDEQKLHKAGSSG